MLRAFGFEDPVFVTGRRLFLIWIYAFGGYGLGALGWHAVPAATKLEWVGWICGPIISSSTWTGVVALLLLLSWWCWKVFKFVSCLLEVHQFPWLPLLVCWLLRPWGTREQMLSCHSACVEPRGVTNSSIPRKADTESCQQVEPGEEQGLLRAFQVGLWFKCYESSAIVCYHQEVAVLPEHLLNWFVWISLFLKEGWYFWPRCWVEGLDSWML